MRSGPTIHGKNHKPGGLRGVRWEEWYVFVNKLSGVKESIDGKGRASKMTWKEVLLHGRILFCCDLRGATSERECSFATQTL